MSDVRVGVQGRQAPVTVKKTLATSPIVEQPVATVVVSELAQQFDEQPTAVLSDAPQFDESTLAQIDNQPNLLVEISATPTYSNLSDDQKAAILERALAIYGQPELPAIEAPIAARTNDLAEKLSSSYRTVVITFSQVVPRVKDNLKSNVERLRRLRARRIEVEPADVSDQTPSVESLTDPVQLEQSDDQSAQTPAETVVTDQTQPITTPDTAVQVSVKKGKQRGQHVLTVVSVAALVLVTVACVDTWVTNRNINRDIDNRISLSMTSQSQPSQ